MNVKDMKLNVLGIFWLVKNLNCLDLKSGSKGVEKIEGGEVV